MHDNERYLLAFSAYIPTIPRYVSAYREFYELPGMLLSCTHIYIFGLHSRSLVGIVFNYNVGN